MYITKNPVNGSIYTRYFFPAKGGHLTTLSLRWLRHCLKTYLKLNRMRWIQRIHHSYTRCQLSFGLIVLDLLCFLWFELSTIGLGTLNPLTGLTFTGQSIIMGTQIDFVQMLESNMSLNILMCLNDPADVVRAGCVSRLWYHFVITNGLSKQLCLRTFPQLSKIAQTTVPDCGTTEADDVGSSNSSWDILKRDHNAFASLLQAIKTSTSFQSNCIDYAVSASSTDRFPDESINNTITTRDRLRGRPSYWSSKGHADPDASETLIYKLKADLCVITEIRVQPFEAFFQPGKPIYSAKSVRFRLGHAKTPLDNNVIRRVAQRHPADDKIIWTYTSELYPMAQENCLQQFKLPEPVLCIGGYLQIELLGRVQRQQTDDLFYVCVFLVKALGRPLFPAFDVEILESSGKFVLRFRPDIFVWMLLRFIEDSNMPSSPEEDVFDQIIMPNINPLLLVDDDGDEPFVIPEYDDLL